MFNLSQYLMALLQSLCRHMGLRVVKDGTTVASEGICLHHLKLHLDKCCMYMLEALGLLVIIVLMPVAGTMVEVMGQGMPAEVGMEEVGGEPLMSALLVER